MADDATVLNHRLGERGLIHNLLRKARALEDDLSALGYLDEARDARAAVYGLQRKLAAVTAEITALRHPGPVLAAHYVTREA